MSQAMAKKGHGRIRRPGSRLLRADQFDMGGMSKPDRGGRSGPSGGCGGHRRRAELTGACRTRRRCRNGQAGAKSHLGVPVLRAVVVPAAGLPVCPHRTVIDTLVPVLREFRPDVVRTRLPGAARPGPRGCAP